MYYILATSSLIMAATGYRIPLYNYGELILPFTMKPYVQNIERSTYTSPTVQSCESRMEDEHGACVSFDDDEDLYSFYDMHHPEVGATTDSTNSSSTTSGTNTTSSANGTTSTNSTSGSNGTSGTNGTSNSTTPSDTN